MDSLQISRRSLGRLSTLLALGIPLVSCGAQNSPAPSASSVSEQILRFAHAAPVTSLDPAQSTSLETGRVCAQILEGLMSPNLDTGFPEAGLAAEWTVSKDALTYTFTLRPGVTFHDGEQLTAQAVVKNFDRFKQLAHSGSSPALAWYLQFFGTGEQAKALKPLIKSYSGQGDQFIIELTRPSVSFLTALTQPAFALVSPQTISQQGLVTGLPAGTGPYTCSSWDKGVITLAQTPQYWGGKPAIDRIIFSAIPSSDLRFYQLTEKNIDAYDQIGLNDFVPLARAGFQTRIRDPYAFAYVGLNLHNPFMQDPLVRQALALAIDSWAIIAEAFPQGSTAASDILPPLFMMSSEKIRKLTDYDLKRAKGLLEQSSYAGEPLDFYYPTDVALTSMENPEIVYANVSAHLTRAGFTIKPKPIKWSDGYLDKMKAKDPTQALFLNGFIGSYRDPNAFIWRVLAPLLATDQDIDSLVNTPKPTVQGPAPTASPDPDLDQEALQEIKPTTPRYKLSEIIDMLYLADQEKSLEERRELYTEANHALMEHMLALPLAFAVSSVALSRKIAAYPMSSTGLDDLAHAMITPSTT